MCLVGRLPITPSQATRFFFFPLEWKLLAVPCFQPPLPASFRSLFSFIVFFFVSRMPLLRTFAAAFLSPKLLCSCT